MPDQPLLDCHHDVICLRERFPIAEPKHREAERPERVRAARIGFGGIGGVVLATVELDHDLRFEASEVGEVATDRPLAAELRAFDLAVAKAMPQRAFRVGGGSAQCAGPHPSPLPRAGEGIGPDARRRHAE